VFHDRAEDARLDMIPFHVITLGDGDEVATKEHAGDAGDGEDTFGQR
jgi:hypothetical protein